MKKIPSLFVRDDRGRLTSEYHPLADWVVRGDGHPTRKWDGTAVAVIDGVIYARYDAKSSKVPPGDFRPCQEPDPVTGHWPGWVPATRPQDVWIREAAGASPDSLADWTYEAVGPKIGGNPERLADHCLMKHGGSEIEYVVPVDRDGLVAFFEDRDVEGVVWWRDRADLDCDKIKITGAALGVRRRSR